MLLTVENLQAINDAVKAANEAKAKAENDLAVANTAKETAENSLTAVVNDLDSLSDSIKNAADNKAKVQVIRDIVAKIPERVPTAIGKRTKTTSLRTSPQTRSTVLRMSNTKLFYYGF